MVFDPFSAMRLTLEATRIGVDSQIVIAMRLAGMLGLWETEPQEWQRMIAEKPRAAQRSLEHAIRAAMRGETPDRVLSAGMRPFGKHTSHNVKRLTKVETNIA